AIDPTMPSGQGGAVPAAAHTSARASRANARFVAITAGQPPAASEPTYSIAFGTVSQPVGSLVPVQSNSRWKRERSARVTRAPWLMVSGRTSFRRSRRTHRNSEPLGAQSHLWQLPL